ncbi:MAG: ABC-type molybdate transport system, periplasmic component [Promethearchaeota archaeon]|nr:MAG: ABC-type molybdate transport system, periplasmic component [Candidatus Lokiarchaeota archaeon]
MTAFTYMLVSGIWLFGDQSSSDEEGLFIYCGAGMKKPMQNIGILFNHLFDIKITYNFAGSNTLLSQIQLYRRGDVYMPGATYYIEQANNSGLILTSQLVAYHTPVIAVPQGNPQGILDLVDLARSEVKVVFGDPNSCAIGKLGKQILEKNNLWNLVEPNIEAKAGTVNELVLWISSGVGEASIVWKSSLVGTEDKTDVVPIVEEKNIIKKIPIGLLTFSEKKQEALFFIVFVCSSIGKFIFQACGFDPYY